MKGSEDEDTQESDNDTENDSQETESSSLGKSTIFQSENSCEHCGNSNVYRTLIMKCSQCSWHDRYKICPIYYVTTRPPRREITSKRAFFVTIVDKVHTKTPRRWKPIFIPLPKRRKKEITDFHPFQPAVYFIFVVFQ